MIYLKSTTELNKWIANNRPDKGSDKPYFVANQVEDGYEIPENGLIERGLNELGIDYTFLINIRGINIEIESKDLE